MNLKFTWSECIVFFCFCVETNATNPQFRIRVPSGHPSKAHVVVAVAQKYECYRSRMFEEEQVGFCIYEVPPGILFFSSIFHYLILDY